MEWAYGITTVPERIQSGCLEYTIDSLAQAGFDNPHLFVDDAFDSSWKSRIPERLHSYPVTGRYRRMGIHANWVLSLTELCFLHPHADRFAIFQDDIFLVDWAKEYLDNYRIPEHAYLNLLTVKSNLDKKRAWEFYPAKNRCRGAQALVFSQKAARELLSSQPLMKYINNHRRGEGIDIIVALAMKHKKHRPFVHTPTLAFHRVYESTVGHPQYQEMPLCKRERVV